VRILHVTPYFAPAFRYGGPPQSVLGLCQGLASVGVEVDVITTTANGDTPLPSSPPDGVDIYEGIPVHYAPQAFPRRFFGAALDAPLRRALPRADVCHIHGIWNVAEWLAASGARRFDVPYIISPRGMLQPAAMSHHRWRKSAIYRLVEQRNLLGASRLHATAPDETSVLGDIVGSNRVVEIPNGVDVVAAEPQRGAARHRFGIPAGEPMVLFLGRLHPIKRIDLLAAAIGRVHERWPRTHLVIAGPDESGSLAALRPQLAPLGSLAHIAGAVEETVKRELLADAAALVLCSDSESFGMSVLEAMAAAVPVVVTRTCGWTDVGRDGCGWSVDQNPAAIAGAIEHAIAQPERAAAMGRRGRQIARDRYSWRAIAERMAACYEDVLSRRAVA
jgi:glycosyltransferase involved in cell wall biosynthesis